MLSVVKISLYFTMVAMVQTVVESRKRRIQRSWRIWFWREM